MNKNDWLEQAYEDIEQRNAETIKILKPNEAVFECGGMVYYTQDKKEVEEHCAIVSNCDDMIHILWCETDEEIIEDYIKNLGEKAPDGTFFIKFWAKYEQTSYEYDEWDITTSINFELEKYSDLNFEATLKQYKKYEEVLKEIKQLAYLQSVAYDDNDFLRIDLLNIEIRQKTNEVLRA